MTGPAPSPLTDARLAELTVRYGQPGPVRRRWVGATSTVVVVGPDVVVKVPHDDEEAVRVCLLHAAVCQAVRRLGVSAPEILAVEQLAGWTVPAIVSSLVPGDALAPGAGPAAIWVAVGSELVRLHQAPADAVPPGLRTFRQHEAVDPGPILDRLRDQGRLSAATARRLRRLRDSLAPAVLPDVQQVLCHGDLHAGNVIAHDGRFSGLVDFAGAGWLDTAWDFAAVPAVALEPLLAGYRSAGGVLDGLPARIVWCRLQLAVHRLPGAADPEADAVSVAVQASALQAQLGA